MTKPPPSAARFAQSALLLGSALLQGQPAFGREPEVQITATSDLQFGTFMVFGSGARTVSVNGVVSDSGVVQTVRTERGGYFFFEQLRPGSYALIIDPEQAARLGICLTDPVSLEVAPLGDVLARDLSVTSCPPPAEVG